MIPNESEHNKHHKKLRNPTTDEVLKMAGYIGRKVSLVILWDARVQTRHGILTEVDHDQIYIPPYTMPFKGKGCGIMFVLCDEEFLYEIT